jgi:hypothetical protein
MQAIGCFNGGGYFAAADEGYAALDNYAEDDCLELACHVSCVCVYGWKSGV